MSRDRDPGYESVGFRDPQYETVESSKRAVSLEPGYETLPDRVLLPGVSDSNHEVYSVVNKKPRSAPAARLPPETLSDVARNNSENISEEEEGYETIPADKRKDSYDPGYETLPTDGVTAKKSESGYEVITQTDKHSSSDHNSDADVDNKLKQAEADIEYIDESADELEDGLSDLKTGEKIN